MRDWFKTRRQLVFDLRYQRLLTDSLRHELARHRPELAPPEPVIVLADHESVDLTRPPERRRQLPALRATLNELSLLIARATERMRVLREGDTEDENEEAVLLEQVIDSVSGMNESIKVRVRR